MRLTFKLKHYLFNAFREIFVYHHGSLEFRAKIFALLIAADEISRMEYHIGVKNIGLKIYNGDEDRANLLMLTTKELVKKVKDNNGLNIDTLVNNIQHILKMVPRYAKKIDIDQLRELTTYSHDHDTIAYQENIIEFLENTKNEILQSKKIQIALDEEKLIKK